MKYLYIEYKPNFKHVYIMGMGFQDMCIIINRNLEDDLRHSQWFPESKDQSICHIDYLELQIVKYNNKDYIKIEWEPYYMLLSLFYNWGNELCNINILQKNYHPNSIDADVVWTS